MAGFEFTETMSGTWRRGGPGEAERPLKFSLRARVGSMARHLADRKAEIEGTIDADGLAAGAPLHGELIMDPLLGRRVRYDFSFRGDDGALYRFAGQKDVSLLDPVGSMTTLPADITDESGVVVASALVRFEMRDLPSFLASFRPVL